MKSRSTTTGNLYFVFNSKLNKNPTKGRFNKRIEKIKRNVDILNFFFCSYILQSSSFRVEQKISALLEKKLWCWLGMWTRRKTLRRVNGEKGYRDDSTQKKNKQEALDCNCIWCSLIFLIFIVALISTGKGWRSRVTLNHSKELSQLELVSS